MELNQLGRELQSKIEYLQSRIRRIKTQGKTIRNKKSLRNYDNQIRNLREQIDREGYEGTIALGRDTSHECKEDINGYCYVCGRNMRGDNK